MTNFSPGLDPDVAVSTGLITKVGHIAKFGYVPAAPLDVEVTVWPGNTRYVFPPDLGEAMEIVSDDPADIGMLVILQMLDTEFMPVDVPVVLDGVTPVAIGTFTRINRGFNFGSTEFAGNVSVRTAGGAGNDYAIMLAQEQLTTQLIYTVPADTTALPQTSAFSLNKSGNQDSSAIIRFRTRLFGSVFVASARFGLSKRGASAMNLILRDVTELPPKTDLELTCEADAADSDVSARIPLRLLEI